MNDEIQILLVEDNPGDVRLTREALRSAKVANELHVVGDGEEAIEFLRQRGRHHDAPRPDIVLLDLNLPRIDGAEVLEDIKSDVELSKIPIIVLTSSSAEVDIQQAYELHANCFISKPVDFTEFIEAVRSLEGFWLKIVRLPTR
ncbi:MAG: receiver box response regulator [Ilumatobacteraceae bacterium]|nr:receiver box response regulator [Ilumatobacteraceae bacterium]